MKNIKQYLLESNDTKDVTNKVEIFLNDGMTPIDKDNMVALDEVDGTAQLTNNELVINITSEGLENVDVDEDYIDDVKDKGGVFVKYKGPKPKKCTVLLDDEVVESRLA